MTTLERAARALHDQLCTKCLDDGSILIEGPISPLQLQMTIRAVLAAIREPSFNDLRKVEAYADEVNAQFDISPEKIFTLVIDAMLEEG